MNSNAPGQLLGYTIQFPRALCHLLKSGPGDFVCIEVLGDVASVSTNNQVIVEEDKSSIAGNPLTNRSTDLWKTFANWIKAVNGGELDLKKTRFILYCNKSGESGLINKFSAAIDQAAARSALDEARKELEDIKVGHAIWDDYDLVINKNEELFLGLIERFELQIGKGAGFDEVVNEIKRKHVSETQIDFLANLLGGWLYKNVTEKISGKKQAIIKWEEFDHQFKVAFDRARRMELIDFTLQNPINNIDIQGQVRISPVYLQQLREIDLSDDDILEAVTDFLRAKVNRDKWIEDETIDEDVAADFEARLKEFWKNKSKAVELTYKTLNEKERGQLVLVECKSRVEAIRDMQPPRSTIAGTYHSLADKIQLGWHPNWEKIFPNGKK